MVDLHFSSAGGSRGSGHFDTQALEVSREAEAALKDALLVITMPLIFSEPWTSPDLHVTRVRHYAGRERHTEGVVDVACE